MRMSVGIGPFRFYSGSSRRRSRKQREADNEALGILFVLALLGVLIYVIVKIVIAAWPVLLAGAAVGVAVFGIIKLIDRRTKARLGPGPTAKEIQQAAIREAIAPEHSAHVGDGLPGLTAEEVEQAAHVRGTPIGEAIAREHPAHAGEKSHLRRRTVNNVMITAMHVCEDRKLSPRERHFVKHAAYDEATRLGFPSR